MDLSAKASLFYNVSSKTSRATKRNPVPPKSQSQKKKKKKKCPKEVASAKGTPKTKLGKRKDREKQRLGGQLWG